MFNLFFIFMIFKLNATNIPIVMTDSNVILDLEWWGKETRTWLFYISTVCLYPTLPSQSSPEFRPGSAQVMWSNPGKVPFAWIPSHHKLSEWPIKRVRQPSLARSRSRVLSPPSETENRETILRFTGIYSSSLLSIAWLANSILASWY